MTQKRLIVWKVITLAAVAAVMVSAGVDFRKHRTYKETILPGRAVVVKPLSSYHPPLEGTAADTGIYFLDSGKPGGTALVIGGTHPEEPASNLAAQILVENAVPEQGRLIVAIRANRSASTSTRPGDAYPQFYSIPTPWGKKTFRMGDRWTNPLDSWPDPEVYVHFPSGQMLAYMDIRNLNRTWPGRANGMITEQVCYAFINLIKNEKVDLVIDYHEAELEYPVISTIVTHEKGREIAAMVSMLLTSGEFKNPIGVEYSPPSLHGLSHREIGDHTQAASLLFETPEPFLDRVRGITDEKLLLAGQDDFVMKAGARGLLYEKITEKGWPIDVRVGRHCSATLEVFSIWSEMNPKRTIRIGNVPRYADIIENGTGSYFHEPKQDTDRKVIFD